MTRPAHCYTCRKVTAHVKAGQLWRCPCGACRSISVAVEERRHEGREADFWGNVKQTPFCWPWVRPSKRPPQFFFQGQQLRAHRVAYFFAHGTWPDYTAAKCGNPLCVRPDHLVSVTKAELQRLYSKQGRYRFIKMPRRKFCRYGHRKAGRNLRIREGVHICVRCDRRRKAGQMRRYRAKRRMLALQS